MERNKVACIIGKPIPVEKAKQWQREYQDATSKLAAIDEENRRQNRRYTSSSNFAVTSRISSLEEKARKASEEAESAKNTAETKLRELDELKKTSEEKRAQWDAQKAQAEEQLGQWQREYQDATSKLAAIDEENRRQNRRYTSSSNFAWRVTCFRPRRRFSRWSGV